MDKLTEKECWDWVHERQALEPKDQFFLKNLKVLITKLFGKRSACPYAEYIVWDVIYRKYMPKKEGMRVLEIGSAPGDHLVRLSRTFGFIPYGVEYSDIGVELNRKIFSLHNIDPNNVIHTDFFSNEFHEQYNGYFDIVLSRGFIEHFTDIENVVEKHINLLAKGGYLVVSIPNSRGVNYILQWIFDREILSKHNIDIMQKKEFSNIFDREDLTTLFCDYYGTFDFGLFVTKRGSLMHPVRLFCKGLQVILNVVFRVLFKDKGAESRLFSPHLIFIGVKKE